MTARPRPERPSAERTVPPGEAAEHDLAEQHQSWHEDEDAPPVAPAPDVPEADAQEQSRLWGGAAGDDAWDVPWDAPEWDALEQRRGAPLDEDRRAD